MNDLSRWQRIGVPLGKGGQGTVSLAIDRNFINFNDTLEKVTNSISISSLPEKTRIKNFEEGLIKLLPFFDTPPYGALKTLHAPELARDAELAEERLRKEIDALNKIKHKNLIEMIDYGPRWYVSRYYPRKTLDKYPEKYFGNPYYALKDFRNLVLGVCKLHSEGCIHRDIKPQNIFIGNEGELILGDFGLVFYTQDSHSRVSKTFENVGTRDWEPLWAHGIRVEEV